MSRSRDYRRNKDGRAEDRFAERRRRYRPIFRMLGVEDLFAATPRGFQEAIWCGKSPEPVVNASEGVDRRVAEFAQRMMAGAKMPIAGLAAADAELTFADLVSVIIPMRLTFRDVATTPDILPSVRRLLDRALPQLETIWDGYPTLFEHAFRVTESAVISCCRADVDILTWRAEFPEVRGKLCVAGTVYRTPPEVAEFRVDGAPRPAYRVGCPMRVEGVRWVSVPAELVGGSSGAEPLPAFVQAHALRQMHDRLDLSGMRPWSEYNLAMSLINPVRVDGRAGREGGSVMIEYRVQEHKAGYLMVKRVGDRVLVRTFLFLTMAGTPEGDRLARRLRLTRDEAAWLGLHKLSSLAATDVRGDAELCAILDQCGCGQLVEMGRGLKFVPVATGFAAELRKYVGMAPAAAPPRGESQDVTERDNGSSILRAAA